MEKDTAPSSSGAFSGSHCQTGCGCHQAQPRRGGAGGDGDVVPGHFPSPEFT